jgi:uncharacterized protein (DUF983 family)
MKSSDLQVIAVMELVGHISLAFAMKSEVSIPIPYHEPVVNNIM